MQNSNLGEIFDKGITRTWFKSHVLDKINKLRELLDMPPREAAVPAKHFDSQVVDQLKAIDFSPLDTSILGQHNMQKFFSLNFCGIGFEPAELVHATELDPTGVDIDLSGVSN
ncbi:MAG: hypothetical protein ACRYE9_02005 [Janthinobacterium lividum]